MADQDPGIQDTPQDLENKRPTTPEPIEAQADDADADDEDMDDDATAEGQPDPDKTILL